MRPGSGRISRAGSAFHQTLGSVPGHTGIGTVFHYIPLHSSPAGIRYGRRGSDLSVTDAISNRLVRLPLWIGIEEHLDVVMDTSLSILTRTRQH